MSESWMPSACALSRSMSRRTCGVSASKVEKTALRRGFWFAATMSPRMACAMSAGACP